jgi:methylthioribose-1-phosphate isomerase
MFQQVASFSTRAALKTLRVFRRIPFFIAAPLTTVDVNTAEGSNIQIEQRSSEELTHFRGQRVAAEGIGVCTR